MVGGEYTEPPETWSIPLDTQQWHTATRVRTLVSARKQLVRPDETLNQWTELLSLSVDFGRGRSDLERVRQTYLDSFSLRCPGLAIRDLARDESALLFEWSHPVCYGAPARHGIVRVVEGTIGLHTLAYDRQGELDEVTRAAWIERLRGARLEKRVASTDPELSAAHWAVWSGKHARAVEILTPVAERGAADALELLGRLHMEGWGVPLDPEAARRTFERAAEAGSALAAYQLGRIYDEGLGVPKDRERALGWFRRAAEADVVDAQARLGVLLATAGGAGDSLKEAAGWLQRAVAAGHGHARYWLASMQQTGQGMPQDLASAVALYAAAARDGERDAQFALGRLYADGIGVPRDDARAITWLTRAVMQGEDEARVFYQERFGRKRRDAATDEGA